MKTIKQACLFFCVLFLAISSHSEQYLEPESSIYDDDGMLDAYDLIIKEAFRDNGFDEIILKTIVMPSFSSEHVIGLKSYKGNFQIYSQIPDAMYWGYLSQARYR